MTNQSGVYVASMDAQSGHDLGARIADWGDISDGALVGGFQFAYGTSLPTPVVFDCEIAFYADYSGWNNNALYGLAGFYFSELPAASGAYNSWIITVDLAADPNDPNSADSSFSVIGNDLDGDGMTDFGYSYWFPSLSGFDTATGPLVANPDLSIYPNVAAAESALGVDDGYDVYLAHPSLPDVFVYDGTYFLGGWDPNDPNTEYAQTYMALISAGETCGAPGASGNHCSADTNQDCTIGLADLSLLLADYGSTGGALPGDVDDDGDVDLSDLAGLLTQYGDDCNP
jgi:hypothetical protein